MQSARATRRATQKLRPITPTRSYGGRSFRQNTLRQHAKEHQRVTAKHAQSVDDNKLFARCCHEENLPHGCLRKCNFDVLRQRQVVCYD